ncbi:hypothetical protein TNCV_376951 [Trichonephila clavipes]|nr:hypothetical protein TNCV_376951 [Trichonephila clavipes]
MALGGSLPQINLGVQGSHELESPVSLEDKNIKVSIELWEQPQMEHIQGLGSNSKENMDVCKRILPLRHGGTLNSRRAVSPFMWKRKRGGRPLTTPKVFSL